MKSALGVIGCVVPLSSIAPGRANPSTALAPTPLEAFAALPATHVAWSREVGRLDSTEAHAIVAALTLEDTAQPPDRMSGVRLELSTENARDRVYLGEETLGAYKNALDEITTSVLHELSAGTIPGRIAVNVTRCVGARLVWYADQVPRVHALDAAYCFARDSSGLSFSAFKQTDIKFPGQDSAQLSAAIAAAMDQ